MYPNSSQAMQRGVQALPGAMNLEDVCWQPSFPPVAPQKNACDTKCAVTDSSHCPHENAMPFSGH